MDTTMSRRMEDLKLETDIVHLKEDHRKAFPDKAPDVDEAVFSLEEPEQQETELVQFNSRRKSKCVTQSVVTGTFLLYSRQNSSINNSCKHVTSAKSSGEVVDGLSAGLESEFKQSIIPDFNRLLSQEVELEDSANNSQRIDDIRPICQQLIEAGYRANEVFAELRRIWLCDKEGELDVITDGDDEDSPWTEEDCDRIVDVMRTGAQCGDLSCRIVKCHMGKQMIMQIESDLENMDCPMSQVTRRLLGAIIAHSAICDDSQCSIPWCWFFTHCREVSVEEQCAVLKSQILKNALVEDLEEINIEIPESSEFIQLDASITWPCIEYSGLCRGASCHRSVPNPSIPRNGIDFLVNGNFGKYGQLGVTAMSTTLPPIQLNIIRFTSYEDCRELWDGMRNLRHQNIVRHLWSCIDGSTVTVCRDHYCIDSESLENLVDKVKPRSIDTTTAVKYVLGLVSATQYLNSRGIFYLKWTATGIQMNYDYSSAQLCDFSAAVKSSVIKDDDEMIDIIANTLPPNILPPEIFSSDEDQGRIGPFTEVWGVGCILYHINSGHPVHYTFRHDSPENIREMVEAFDPADHLKLVKSNEIMNILAQVFIDEKRRIVTESLADQLRLFLNSIC